MQCSATVANDNNSTPFVDIYRSIESDPTLIMALLC